LVIHAGFPAKSYQFSNQSSRRESTASEVNGKAGQRREQGRAQGGTWYAELQYFVAAVVILRGIIETVRPSWADGVCDAVRSAEVNGGGKRF
jgi:hypothetical protein